MKDRLQKFLFEHAAVRGEFVDLTEAWEQVQENHAYPPAVTSLLGEMLSAAVLLASNIKFNGSLIMQIQGDGPVRLLVAECDSSLHVRATAKLAEDAVIADDASLRQLVHARGRGRFVITLDMNDKVPGQLPYQGIVSLEGENLAEVIENYMQQSEQLSTCIWLAANDSVSRGLLLQKLPEKTGEDGLSQKTEEEARVWDHLVALSSTLNRDEMLGTDIDTLQHRLFWEEDILSFEPQQPIFSCSCSRQKVSDMFRMLGEVEVNEALEEQQGKLTVNCDFCGKGYDFDRVDVAQVFTEDTSTNPAAGPKNAMH
ncbi:Hsp33 family molecular chaperone HslO [Oxalobacter vibrioformis]|uniref:Hsp33 family molecular chaperone HslO n=1 Tax=Oxalobacter vibrioformis TaxID=933080 RepID=A0A9E9LWC3_9BURK|nr:Hsp33 family molecular chaperone HslO [Oxalobacter vibrioformis]NLC23750.1 Hsp33 family molecular chaperone HslO [Oxalobacter sp.]WAW10446.1 Hsp33 family molecular chaperone HslO [Oxalobacter vibrioformis]